MTITERLLWLDSTLAIHNEGEWSNTISLYSAFNDAGVECEVGEFLYSLVRILKPEHVLETGTHVGVGASYMGLALQDNKRGKLDTIEFLMNNFTRAKERIQTLKLDKYVNCILNDVAMFNPEYKYQLILLDTEPQTRFAELVKFFPYLEDGGFIFIHDTPRGLCQGNVNPDWPDFKSWPFGDLPKEIKDWVKEGKLRAFHFGTPRGLIGFYKPTKDDVKWE